MNLFGQHRQKQLKQNFGKYRSINVTKRKDVKSLVTERKTRNVVRIKSMKQRWFLNEQLLSEERR